METVLEWSAGRVPFHQPAVIGDAVRRRLRSQLSLLGGALQVGFPYEMAVAGRYTMWSFDRTISPVSPCAFLHNPPRMHLLPCEFPMPNVLHPFRRKNPRARIPETAFPEPYFFNDTDNISLDDILALLNKDGLMLHQPIDLLERL